MIEWDDDNNNDHEDEEFLAQTKASQVQVQAPGS
jgi:hypothetical protein